LLKKRITNKLFYKRYPYKIRCIIDGAWLLRGLRIDNVKTFIKSKDNKSWCWAVSYRSDIDEEKLENFVEKIIPYLPKIKIRIENSIFNIYTLDEDVYYNLIAELVHYVEEVWAPENQEYLDFLLSGNSVKILCDDLPYKKYRYKVHIKHRLNEETKKSFSNWLKNYSGKIYASGESAKWLENDFYFTWTPCIFVEDHATLSMIGLFLSGSILKVEEYITKVSINTTL
jgi:hypothetical protein